MYRRQVLVQWYLIMAHVLLRVLYIGDKCWCLMVSNNGTESALYRRQVLVQWYLIMAQRVYRTEDKCCRNGI